MLRRPPKCSSRFFKKCPNNSLYRFFVLPVCVSVCTFDWHIIHISHRITHKITIFHWLEVPRQWLAAEDVNQTALVSDWLPQMSISRSSATDCKWFPAVQSASQLTVHGVYMEDEVNAQVRNTFCTFVKFHINFSEGGRAPAADRWVGALSRWLRSV